MKSVAGVATLALAACASAPSEIVNDGQQIAVESHLQPRSFATCVERSVDEVLGRSHQAKTIDDGSGFLEVRIGGKSAGNGTDAIVRVQEKQGGGSRSTFYLGGFIVKMVGTESYFRSITRGCEFTRV